MKSISGSVGLLALALCLAASGQPGTVPRIGWILSGTPEYSRHLVDAMRAGLADEGLVDGHGVVLDVRYTAGRPERYPELSQISCEIPSACLQLLAMLASPLRVTRVPGEFPSRHSSAVQT